MKFRIPALDGLRGLAILLVILRHYFIDAFALGETGVDLFFVLSGYLITGRLSETVGTPGYFRNFYRNRVLRIFPLYYCTLLVFFVGIHFFTKKDTQPLISYYYLHWKSFFLYMQNWTFIRYGFPPTAYLLHFWSLAVEEQFYLFWPFFIFCLKPFQSRKKTFAVIIGLVILIRCVFVFSGSHQGNETFYYYSTFFRMDSLLIGALLFQLHLEKIRIPARATDILIVAGVLFIICASLVSDPVSWLLFNSVGFSVVAFTSAGLIHRSVAYPRSVFARFFDNPLLRKIGKISYGLYVLHLPVVEVLRQRLYDWFTEHVNGNGLAANGFALCVCLLITFSLSYLSYTYFESRFLRLKRAALPIATA